MPPKPRSRWTERLTFGGRVSWAVGLALVLTLGLSLPAALFSRHGAPLFELGALVPDRVFHLEVWRLLTWPFLEISPFGLIFSCLMIYWFGRDLSDTWGPARLAKVEGLVLLGAGVATCLLALVDRELIVQPYLASYALTTTMLIAWGLSFPDRVVRLYFVLPITGFWMAWGTVAVSVVYAIYAGWARFVPELAAEAIMLGVLYRKVILRRLRKPPPKPPLQRKPKPSHLRVVKPEDLN
jgi:membrane associated rhomboid family serine protease